MRHHTLDEKVPQHHQTLQLKKPSDTHIRGNTHGGPVLKSRGSRATTLLYAYVTHTEGEGSHPNGTQRTEKQATQLQQRTSLQPTPSP